MSELCRGGVFVNFNAIGFQAYEKGIELFGRVFLGREHAIHLIRKQIATLLTDNDKVAKMIVFFLGHKHEGFSPSSHCRY